MFQGVKEEPTTLQGLYWGDLLLTNTLCPGKFIQNSLSHGQFLITCEVVSTWLHRGQVGSISWWIFAKKDLVGSRLRQHFHMKIWILYTHGIFHIQFDSLGPAVVSLISYRYLVASLIVHLPTIVGHINWSYWEDTMAVSHINWY